MRFGQASRMELRTFAASFAVLLMLHYPHRTDQQHAPGFSKYPSPVCYALSFIVYCFSPFIWCWWRAQHVCARPIPCRRFASIPACLRIRARAMRSVLVHVNFTIHLSSIICAAARCYTGYQLWIAVLRTSYLAPRFKASLWGDYHEEPAVHWTGSWFWGWGHPFTPKFKKYILPTFLKINVWWGSENW